LCGEVSLARWLTSCRSVVLGDYYSCPSLEPGTAGACVEECSTHSECPEHTRCCSNGCGHVCVAPVVIPYHSPMHVCPEVPEDTSGICVEQCDNCSVTELCCSNGCGHVCMASVVSDTPCTVLRENVMATGLIGAYIPQCEEDGSFSSVQCHSSTGSCWCVTTESGEPVTDMVRFKQPICSKSLSLSLFRENTTDCS